MTLDLYLCAHLACSLVDRHRRDRVLLREIRDLLELGLFEDDDEDDPEREDLPEPVNKTIRVVGGKHESRTA